MKIIGLLFVQFTHDLLIICISYNLKNYFYDGGGGGGGAPIKLDKMPEPLLELEFGGCHPGGGGQEGGMPGGAPGGGGAYDLGGGGTGPGPPDPPGGGGHDDHCKCVRPSKQ